MFTKRPLLDTVADQALFVADDSRRKAKQAAFQHRNTLVVGESGSGKTSLLYQIRASANATNSGLLVLVDARLAPDARSLVDLILASADEAGWVEPAPAPDPDDLFGPVTQLRRLQEVKERDLVVLLDDPDANQARILFGRYRDELWQLPIWFTVAVTPTVHKQALKQPPADAFFDAVIELQPLSVDDGFELLRLRKHGGELPEHIPWPTAPLQPRALLLDAEAGPLAPRQNAALQADLIEAAEEAAGRQGAMLLAEIWGRGAVSASDEALQRSLGLSRARLVQLLRELERAEILTAFPQPTPGSTGRPRTMYDIRSTP